MQNEIKNYQEALKSYKAPRWEDFPQVDLYMDQVIALLSKWLEPLHFDSDKPPVTSSMINNYVKNSIVRPPVKKHYKPYHLAFLYVVLVLKQCYSLQEVSQMIQIYSDIENKERHQNDFDRFAQVFESSLHEVVNTGNLQTIPFEEPTWQQMLMTNAIRTICFRLYTASVINHPPKS